jgi:hypothetical protein
MATSDIPVNTKRWIVWLGIGDSHKIWKKLSTYEDERIAKRVYDAFRKDGVSVRITEED